MRVGYGAAELGIAGVEVLIRVSLLIFYTDVVGLSANLAGYAVALGVLWDAVTDPLMGVISDRTRSRFGRRLPYVGVGALGLGASVVLLFSPPAFESQGGMFAFLLASYMLTNTAMTVVAVPHSALAGDLSDRAGERLVLFGWRLLFANLGLIAGTAIPGIALLLGAGGPGEPERLTSYALAATALGSAGVTLLAVKGRDRPAGTGRLSFAAYFRGLSDVVRNRAFAHLFAAYVVANIGLNINSTLALYYYEYRLGLEQQDTRLLIVVLMVFFSASLVGWVWLGQRMDKRIPLAAGVATLGVMTCLAYPLFPPGQVYWPLFAAVLGGIAIGAVVLLDASLADVVDYDEVRSGESRFGLYFGFWKMGGKASRALAIALSGNFLTWAGFTPNVAQSERTSWLIALAFGPGVGVFFIAGALIVLFVPLHARKTAQVRRILDRRRERAAAAA